MIATWTAKQVLALSPDAGSAKRGQALAIVSKWPVLGRSQRAVWGECQGSGKKPYRTAIDFGEAAGGPAFRCSCPSRKFPCKHSLGLFLLLAQQVKFVEGTPPEWVTDWLDKREKTREKAAEKVPLSQASAATVSPQQAQQAQKSQTQRLEKRALKVADGLVDLDRWLCDIVQRGLADLPSQPYSFWDQAAARLVDAQAPGLAKRVKELAGIPHSGKGWPERMLKALGQLYLLVQGYRQLADLPPMMRAEVLTQIGFSQNKDDLQRRADDSDPLVLSVIDTWQVFGQVVTEEDSLKTQRVWLWGMKSQKASLVLSFAYGKRQPLDMSLLPGACFEGRLIFYPGTGVQRALVISKAAAVNSTKDGMGCVRIEDAIAQYAQSLTENPWQILFPLILRQILLRYQACSWFLQDQDNRLLPVSSTFQQGWEVLAMSGGRPLSVFGEWDGQYLRPLSVWSEKTFMTLEA